MLFGALFLAPALAEVRWSMVAYAPGSLTVIRMAPVAVALLGSKLARPTVACVVLHGVTAPWGARRYGSWHAAAVTNDPGIREAAEPLSVGRRVQFTPWG